MKALNLKNLNIMMKIRWAIKMLTISKIRNRTQRKSQKSILKTTRPSPKIQTKW